MTLCELATAKHYSIPFECAPFTVDSTFSRPGRRSQGECVEWVLGILAIISNSPPNSALSRSAQFWSSYSGYLREVRTYIQRLGPFICPNKIISSALLCIPALARYWYLHFLLVFNLTEPVVDTAREIYKNITLEKAALIQFIISREKTTDLIMRNWENHLLVCTALASCMLQLSMIFRICKRPFHKCKEPPAFSIQALRTSTSTWQRNLPTLKNCSRHRFRCYIDPYFLRYLEFSRPQSRTSKFDRQTTHIV